MKLSGRSEELLREALTRDAMICGLLYTDRALNAFEREMLDTSGCTFLNQPSGTVNRIRFQASAVNVIIT